MPATSRPHVVARDAKSGNQRLHRMRTAGLLSSETLFAHRAQFAPVNGKAVRCIAWTFEAHAGVRASISVGAVRRPGVARSARRYAAYPVCRDAPRA